MDKKQIAKLATAATVTTGMAIALPAVAPFVAPFVVPLIAGRLSDELTGKLGESSLNTISGILSNIASSAIWDAPLSKRSPENHHLLKLIASAYLKGIGEIIKEIEDKPENEERYGKNPNQVLRKIKEKIEKALNKKEAEALDKLFPSKEYLEAEKTKEDKGHSEKVPLYRRLFGYSPDVPVPVNEEFAGKLSSEDFILSFTENPETTKEILAHEIEISLRRWFVQIETASSLKETPLMLSVSEKEFPLTNSVSEKLAVIVPKYIGMLISEEEFKESWISFQRSHLQAILKEIKTNKGGLSEEDRELLRPLAEKLDKLAEDADFPKKLADSTKEILSRLDESEKNVKQCIREERAKLQDYLAAMESRIRGDIAEVRDDIHVVKTELVEEFHKISYERPLPNSIPASIGFVGREEFLQEIREKYQNGSRIFVFHGIGGVGKTALALKFAAEIEDEYKAKIFVDMQGLTNPLSARDAKFAIVKQFDPEVRADISDEELYTEYKSKVQNQPTLIVLDNASDKQSVESLKEAKACLIITSREAFNLTGAVNKHIEQMLPEDARNLLFLIAGEERFEGRADTLAEMAGYLPMALKPLASILAEDELETIEDLIERYSDKKKLFAERVPDYKDLTVEASFELSYEALSKEMKKCWRRLSVFPADFDEKAMTAVLNISESEAKETQKYLRKYSILEVFSEKPPRFNLHDLAREFCDSKLGDDERFDIQFSFAKYYSSIFTNISLPNLIEVMDGKSQVIRMMEMIDAEWNNIKVGQKWSADHLERQNEIALICKTYSLDFPSMDLRLPPRDLIMWIEAGLKACQKVGDRTGEVMCLGNLSNPYRRLGEYKKAIDYSKLALEVTKEINNGEAIDLKGVQLGNLGNSYLSLNKYKMAINYFEQALEIAREIEDRESEGMWLGNLGVAYRNLGENKKAAKFYEDALIILKKTDNTIAQAAHLINFGALYVNLGENKKAIEILNEALEASQEIGDQQGRINALINLAGANLSLEDYKKAVEFYEKALQISKEVEDPLAESKSLNGLGMAFLTLGENKKAIETFEQGLVIAKQISDRRMEGDYLRGLGTAHSGLDDNQNAIIFFEQALEIAKEIPDIEGKGRCLIGLGTIYDNLGERERAYEFWKEALVIFESIKSPDAEAIRGLIEGKDKRQFSLPRTLLSCSVLLVILGFFVYGIVQLVRWLFF